MRTALFPADDPGTPSLQALGVSSHILLPSDVPLTINPLLLPHNLPLMAIVSENVSETRMGAFVQEDSYAVPRTGTRHIHHVQPQSALSVVIIAIAVAAVSAILLVLSVLFPAVSWKGLQQPTPSLTTEAENAVSMEQTEASTKVAKPSDDSHEEEAVLAGSQPPHPRRQAILIQLCVFFVLADFGWASESTFFAGEVQKVGLGHDSPLAPPSKPCRTTHTARAVRGRTRAVPPQLMPTNPSQCTHCRPWVSRRALEQTRCPQTQGRCL